MTVFAEKFQQQVSHLLCPDLFLSHLNRKDAFSQTATPYGTGPKENITFKETMTVKGPIAKFVRHVREAENPGPHKSASGANRQLLCSHVCKRVSCLLCKN